MKLKKNKNLFFKNPTVIDKNEQKKEKQNLRLSSLDGQELLGLQKKAHALQVFLFLVICLLIIWKK